MSAIVRIATAPGTWGIEPGTAADEVPWRMVLDEIAAAGFDGTELGPLGYLPTDPGQLASELRSRGLSLAGGYIMEPLHDPTQTRRILKQAERTCALLAELGARALVLIAALMPQRSAAAGRIDARPPFAGWDRAILVRTLGALVDRALEHRLTPVLHPHAGTFVEFEDEIEDVLEAAGPALCLCVDTGHCYYSGIDATALLTRHGGRVRHVHLKDVHADILRRALDTGSSFQQTVAAGAFCPLGQGSVDLAGFLTQLHASNYDGWATFEQDRPAADYRQARSQAELSLAHLRSLGLRPQPQSNRRLDASN